MTLDGLEIVYRCLAKATRSESGTPRRSQNWVAARRAWLNVSDHEVSCGDWTIPNDQIKSATLYWVKQIGIPAQVLELSTDSETYQFGINPWCRVQPALPFPVERKSVWMRMSAISIFVRIILLGIVTYWLWERF